MHASHDHESASQVENIIHTAAQPTHEQEKKPAVQSKLYKAMLRSLSKLDREQVKESEVQMKGRNAAKDQRAPAAEAPLSYEAMLGSLAKLDQEQVKKSEVQKKGRDAGKDQRAPAVE